MPVVPLLFLASLSAVGGTPRHWTPPAIASDRYESTPTFSPDGREVGVFASGLREAFMAASPRTGAVSASDQQGNFVPATPVYLLSRGGYYGVAVARRVPDAAIRAVVVAVGAILTVVSPARSTMGGLGGGAPGPSSELPQPPAPAASRDKPSAPRPAHPPA